MAWGNGRIFPSGKVAVAGLLVLASLGAPAFAFAKELSTAEPKENAAYRSAVKDALAEYDAGHFEEARTLFRRAHGIEPSARTWRGIGMASLELGDYVAAVRALSAALIDTRKPLSPEQLEHARSLLERSQMFVDVYTLTTRPPDVGIVIDGQPVEREPDGTVLVGFGNHMIEASKSGYVVRALPFTVRGGEHKQLVVNLERKPPEPTGTAKSSLSPTAAQDMAPTTASGAATAGTGWLLAAGGAGLLGIGAAAYWGVESAELGSCRGPPQGLRCNNESALVTKRNLGIGATALASASALTMAVIGIVQRASTSPAARASSLSCIVIPSGISCARTF